MVSYCYPYRVRCTSYMKILKTCKISIVLLFTAVILAFTTNINAQTLIVNENTTNESETTSNVINLESNDTKKESNDTKKETNVITLESKKNIGILRGEISGGSWVLTGVNNVAVNGLNITKWKTNNRELDGNCTWIDKLNIEHTVESGFKWQEPPQTMQPGTYLNLEAVYTNIDYSTTAPINTGIKMFFASTTSDIKVMDDNAVEVLKLNKDNKQYSNEVKKGFFYAPNIFFDETNNCQLVVDCYIGKDHYITTYTYEYRP